MSPVSLVIHVVVVSLAAWFWPHCARPVLVARGATPAAYWLVFGVTIVAVGVWGTSLVTGLLDFGSPDVRYWLRNLSGFAWIVVVGLGYLQNYSLLLRLTSVQATRS